MVITKAPPSNAWLPSTPFGILFTCDYIYISMWKKDKMFEIVCEWERKRKRENIVDWFVIWDKGAVWLVSSFFDDQITSMILDSHRTLLLREKQVDVFAFSNIL